MTRPQLVTYVPPPPLTPAARARRALGPALLALLAAALLAATWMAWTDHAGAIGTEPYAAWRLAHGAVAGRDVALREGPLPPYVNALVFRLCGPSLRLWVVANLAVFAAAFALFLHLGTLAASRLAATAAGALFLTVLAVGGTLPGNWLMPTCCGATHGLVLALAGLAALAAYQRGHGRRRAWLVFAGLAVGCAFLTRWEPLLAAATASTLFLAVLAPARALSPGDTLRALLTFALAALTPPFLALIFLARALSVPDALAATLAGWIASSDGPPAPPWLPATILLLTLLASWQTLAWWKSPRPATGHSPAALRLDLAIFAFALALAALINGTDQNLAVYLAPAGIVLVWAAVAWLPKALPRRPAQLLRGTACAALLAVAILAVYSTFAQVASRTVAVGSGRDRLWMDHRGRALHAAVTWLRERTAPAQTLATVGPDGPLLNFLARRPAPAPYAHVTPAECAAFGEHRILQSWQHRPPDCIVILPPDDRPALGRDYGWDLAAWINAAYVAVPSAPPTDPAAPLILQRRRP